MDTRRQFIKNVSVATLAVGCGIGVSSMLVGCAPIKYVSGDYKKDKITLNTSDFDEQKFVVINNEQLGAPIYVTKDDNGYGAFLMLCTHLQCELKPTGTFMTCPCHGSEFSNKGEVLNGPAYEPLTTYELVVENNKIIIKLKD